MALFALVFALELRPMMTFLHWRTAKGRVDEVVASSPFDALVKLNDAETILVLVIPFVAALMARETWLF